MRQGSQSRCGRRQDVAAGGRTRCCERLKLPNRRQEPHHQGRIRCLGSAAGDTIAGGRKGAHASGGKCHCSGWKPFL